jgi:uncharacterized iron-regulated membrane protein
MEKPSMHRWALNLHLLLSLVFGVFISTIAVTGGIIGFEPEIDRVLHRRISYVTPGKRPLTLDQLRQAVSMAYPGEAVVAILPALADNQSWKIVLPAGIAYVNQYTGQSLGLRTRGETFLGKVRALHVGLVAGAVGRSLVKWTTLAAVPLLLSGIFLWWPQKRFRLGGSIHNRRFWLDLHNALGITAALFLLLLATTGAVMAFSDQLLPHLYRIAGAPPMAEGPRYTVKLSESYQVTPDQALAVARKAVPQAAPCRIQFPSFGGTYVVDLVDPNDRIVGERNSVVIDPHSGAILLQRNATEVHAIDRGMAAIAGLHAGNLIGTVGKALLCIASLLTLAIFASGIIMVWLRAFRHQQPLLR